LILSSSNIPAWHKIHTIVFDFDGVFTDNRVWIDQDGLESVSCNRSDGLGFDMLRNFMRLKNWNLNCFILSKESNPVVSVRANKLKIDCVQNISNKKKYLESYLLNCNLDPEGLVYMGNDLNDMPAMELAGFSITPSDAHIIILNLADIVLTKKGGEGCVREFIEVLIGINSMHKNEIEDLLI